MAGVRIKKYKGKDVLFIDLEGSLFDEAMVDIVYRAQKYILDSATPYLQLINLINAFVTPAFMQEVRKVVQSTPFYETKRAMVGINSPSKQILFERYDELLGGGKIQLFDSLNEALEYLVS